MTQYAYYDHTQPPPQRVIGWLDDAVNVNLPAQADLLVLTAAQWTARSSFWMVQGGTLIPYVPPPLTLSQQAAVILQSGIPIESTGTPSLTATYPCTQASIINEMGQLAALNAGLTLPGGGAATVLDVNGRPHSFLPPQFLAYSQAKLNYMQLLNTIIGSNEGTLPNGAPIIIP